MSAIVTYETQHGSAKKIAEVIARELDCKFINVDTPFEAEDLSEIDTLVVVFNFRGPYTAQLSKLFLDRIKDQLKNKNLILVGEGIFSEKEFPVVALEISELAPSKVFEKFFVKGQLRTGILYPEEKALLKKFGELTKMEIKDMGELDLELATKVAKDIKEIDAKTEKSEPAEKSPEDEQKWKCPLCGYIHMGPNPPEKCPLCGAPGSSFQKL